MRTKTVMDRMNAEPAEKVLAELEAKYPNPMKAQHTAEVSFTPGSWIVDGAPKGIKIWSDQKGRSAEICKITPRPEDEANARLIAAAPDLLEACKAAESIMGQTGEGQWTQGHRSAFTDALIGLRQIITKATAQAGGE